MQKKPCHHGSPTTGDCAECKREYMHAYARTPEYRAKDAARRRLKSEYYRENSRKWRAVSENKRQKKGWELKSKYGITIDDFEAMLLDQNGQCWGCGLELAGSGRDRDAPVVDHCHRTGTVRAILCHRCNFVEGHISKMSLDVILKLKTLSEGVE